MSSKEVIENCINDRDIVYKNTTKNFIKKYTLDLVIKTIILLINSFGIKSKLYKKVFCFVDEIKNNNMHENLMLTYNKSLELGNNSLLINYYKIGPNNNHIKIGIITPIVLIIITVFLSFLSLIIDIITNKRIHLLIQLLVIIQLYYYKQINVTNDSVFYLMTDHHFFSSILASAKRFTTIVLQHGLVLDKRFYYPVRATKFYAWGKRTSELLNHDYKVKITGTYKFDNLISIVKNDSNNNVSFTKNILYCVSTLDHDKTLSEIDAILKVIGQNDKYCLIIKEHPGSLFDRIDCGSYSKEIIVYKEKTISDIDFDLAIVGDSTIIIDLAVLKKPFIYYGVSNGYFEQYKGCFLTATNETELYNSIMSFESFDFNNTFSTLYSNEINNLKHDIF